MLTSSSLPNPAEVDISVPRRLQYAEVFGTHGSVVRFRVAGATGWVLSGGADATAGLDRADRVDRLVADCVTLETHSLDVETLGQLTVGDYNAVAAGVAQATFGNAIDLTQRCPDAACHAELEWPLVFSQLIGVSTTARDISRFEFEGSDYSVRPAAVREARSLVYEHEPLDSLIRMCVEPDPSQIASNPEARKFIEAAFEEADPLADIAFGLPCVGCGIPFRTSIDPMRVLDDLLEADDAQRDDDHHVLALAYGWRPSDMLELTPIVRRRFATTASDRWAG